MQGTEQAAAAKPRPRTPTSAYKAGAFDTLGLRAPIQEEAPPAKPARKWFNFQKSKSRCARCLQCDLIR